MLKMSEELAQTFQYKMIRVMDKNGKFIDEYNGERHSVRAMIGNEWAGHTVYSINPGCRFENGKPVISLDIWMDI